MADDAGALLVRSGLIADDQLHRARTAQAAEGGTLAEHLVLGGAVNDEDLTRFFRTRLMVPQVNPNDLAQIPPRIIAKVPADMAAEFRAVPVHLDRDGNLTVAMADPSNSHAVDEIAFFTGHYVVRAVATQLQVAWSLAHYYGFVTPLGETLLAPEHSPADGVPRAVRPTSVTDQVRALRHDVHVPIGDPDERATPPEIAPGLVIVAEEPTPPTGPQRPYRPLTDPPELAPRAGEVMVSGPRGGGSDTDLPAVVIEEANGSETSPILLDQRRGPSSPVTSEGADPPSAPTLEVIDPNDDDGDDDGDDTVVLLSRPRERRRKAKPTRIGLGFPMPTRRSEDNPVGQAPEARGNGVPREDLDVADTGAVERDTTGRFEKLGPEHITGDELDDGWGPPGTTIPPPYLGAMPGTDIDDFDPGHRKATIPIATDDFDDVTEPLELPAPESPLEDRTVGALESADDTVRTSAVPAAADPELAGLLAEAALRLVEVVRDLDHAESRDRVIDRLMEHFGDSHDRVAFFVLRKGELRLWRRRGERPDTGDHALSLDHPSTMQDLVRTRLPYRGPSIDPQTRALVAGTLGEPRGDILLVPVDVRGRVVGVLYADGPHQRIFEEHMAVVSRAAGMALERILKDRKA